MQCRLGPPGISRAKLSQKKGKQGSVEMWKAVQRKMVFRFTTVAQILTWRMLMKIFVKAGVKTTMPQRGEKTGCHT